MVTILPYTVVHTSIYYTCVKREDILSKIEKVQGVFPHEGLGD